MNYPIISVIIPVFNEEKLISKCLDSLRYQNYPSSKIRIFIIDDYSTDNTLTLVKPYRVKVINNGTHNIERAKSIGLENTTSEYVLFIDADNALTSPNWIKDSIDILIANTDIVGIESNRIRYKKNDTLANRYCALFGINDPLVFYLGKRGYLMAGEKKWSFPPGVKVIPRKNYDIVQFNEQNLQTIGSNGYLTRRSLLIKTKWKPLLFHLDSAYDLVKMGKNKFARINYDVEHYFADSLLSMLNKLRRNIDLFWKFRHLRRFDYNLGSFRFLLGVAIALTFIVPLIDSLKGYRRVRDIAWFIHPFMCFATILIYFVATLKNRVKFIRDHFTF